MTYIALTGIVLALAACGAAFLISDGSGISRPLTVLPGTRKRFGSVGSNRGGLRRGAGQQEVLQLGVDP